MLLGLGTSAMLFLPAILAQMKGKSNFSLEQLAPAVRTSLKAVLSTLYIYSETNVSSNPVIYTGGVVLVLCLVLLLHKAVPKRIRIGHLLFLAVGIGCFCLTTTDVLLSCVRIVGSYFFRYSFLLSFLFVMIAGQCLEYIGQNENDSKERKGISEKYAFCLAVLILIAGMLVLEWQSAKKTALIAIVLLLAIYGICYYGFLHTKKRLGSLCLSASCLCRTFRRAFL